MISVTIIALNNTSKVILNQRCETEVAVLYNRKEKGVMAIYIDNSNV